MRLRILGAIVALLSASLPAFADEGASDADIVTFGRRKTAGIEVVARGYAVPDNAVGDDAGSPGSVARTTGAVTVAAPVAISAHNCIPRTDSRGISLSYEFFESPIGDCISFVSPPPVEDNPRPNARRPRRPSPEALAQAAFDRVISLAPRPELRVAPGRIGLTGLPSYFWIGNDLSPVTAAAGVRGLTVQAEARPVRFRWGFGDGVERHTAQPGRAWSREDRGNVGHVYETKGRYEPDVTVVWAARWRVNGGPWQDLGYFTTDGSIGYPVREMVSVLVRRR